MTRQDRRSAPAGALAVALCGALAGCDLSEPYATPQFPFLGGFANAMAGTPVLLDNAAWWEGLDDPVLDQLIGRALAENLDIATARERVLAARAERNAVPGAATLTPRAEAELRGVNADLPDPAGTAEIGLDWMLDPYGTRRDRLRAADGRVEIARAEEDAAQLLMLLNLANAYVQLRHDQRLVTLARREIDRQRAALDQVRRQIAAESATRLDAAQAEARLAEFRSRLPAREAAVAAALNEIAVLTGAQPGTLPEEIMAELRALHDQPVPRLTPDVGIPADLLRNRPDIRISERRYYIAVAGLGPARAALYPRLSLSGAITLNLLGAAAPGTEYYFGPVVQFPALPSSANRASIEAAHAEARAAHADWKAAVLEAILEVENALVDYNAAATATGSAAEASRLYREVRTLTRNLQENDEATEADVISADLALIAAERSLAGLHLRQAQSFIALNVRLGSGNPAGSRHSARSG